jgi:hypothetical protein
VRHCRIQDPQGQLIVHRVSRGTICRLLGRTEENKAPRYDTDGRPDYNPALVSPHRHQPGLYISLVSAAVIRAECQRDIANRLQKTQANQTTKRVHFSTPNGRSGVRIEHNFRVIYSNYGSPEDLDRLRRDA